MTYEVGERCWLTADESTTLRSQGFELRWTGEVYGDENGRMDRYEVTAIPSTEGAVK